ncbi:MAG: hypothetical protein JO081_12625, partial [Alphaproteobacteria bacterium]|nr:hypothetical protein [Alphaproteobacteria bacterium]
AAAIAWFFPALEQPVLARSLGRYQRQRVWGSDPVLPEAGFERLRGGLLSGGFIRRPVPYSACVDNRLARQLVARSDNQG